MASSCDYVEFPYGSQHPQQSVLKEMPLYSPPSPSRVRLPRPMPKFEQANSFPTTPLFILKKEMPLYSPPSPSRIRHPRPMPKFGQANSFPTTTSNPRLPVREPLVMNEFPFVIPPIPAPPSVSELLTVNKFLFILPPVSESSSMRPMSLGTEHSSCLFPELVNVQRSSSVG